jgi:hypothetical protein
VLQGTIIWGTAHTIVVTVNDKEKPFYVNIPQ